MERRGGALLLRVGALAGAEMVTRLSDVDDDMMVDESAEMEVVQMPMAAATIAKRFIVLYF